MFCEKVGLLGIGLFRYRGIDASESFDEKRVYVRHGRSQNPAHEVVRLRPRMMDESAEDLAGLGVRKDTLIHWPDDVGLRSEFYIGRVARARIPSRPQLPHVESPVLDKITGADWNGSSGREFGKDGLRGDYSFLDDRGGDGGIAGQCVL